MSNGKRDFDIAELKSVLEDAYSIGKINKIESIACDEEELLWASGALAGASESSEDINHRTSYRISSETGEYFLKRVSDWIEEGRLAEIEGFIRWTDTKKHDLCPAIKVSVSGKTHIAVGGHRIQLFDFVTQEKRQIWMRSQLSQEDCTLAGDLLARMHLASADYLRENTDKEDCFSFPVDWSTSFETLFQRIGKPDASSLPVILSVAENKDHIRARLSKAVASISLCEKSATPLLLHGDYHPGNVLFFKSETGANVVSLVDFDYLRRGHPFYDLGYALIMFARSQSSTETNRSERIADQRLDWQLGKDFLRGYLKALRKNPAEKEEFQIRKAEVMAACHSPPRLPSYVTIACFLIMDWAVEKLINQPGRYSDVYAGVIEMIYTLGFGDVEEVVQNLWIEALTE